MTSRYGRRLSFGVFPVPNAADLELIRSLALRADELGLELIGIQDHPYQRRYVETWALIADLIARTESVRFFPDVADVANLPLRGPGDTFILWPQEDPEMQLERFAADVVPALR